VLAKGRGALLLGILPLVACNLLLNFSAFDSEYGAPPASDASNEADASDVVVETCDAALSSDPQNCGHCGHDCLGGVCLDMQCQPVTLAPVHAGTVAASIALDADHVYWSDTPGIMAVEKDGGALSTVAPLPAEAGVTDIAVDTSGLYWSMASSIDGGSGIYRLVDGGTMPFFQAGAITSLTLDGNDVYWTSTGLSVVRRVPKAGGSAVDIVDYSTPPNYQVGNIAMGSALLYWTDAVPWPNVSSAPKLGCNQGAKDCGTALAPVSSSAPNGLIVDDAGIFWSTSGTLNRTGSDGGPSSTMYTSTTGGIRALAADAVAFYLAIGKPPQILSVSRGDGSAALVANLPNDEFPLAIAVDEVAIYFVSAGITQGNIGVGDGGRIGSIAK
jgi:hypothetical protein